MIQRPNSPVRPPRETSIPELMARALKTEQAQKLRPVLFETERQHFKPFLAALKRATKGDWKDLSYEQLEGACAEMGFNKQETSWVLTFRVYWKFFENTPDLRENPDQWSYIVKEPFGKFEENGYFSFWLSLLDDSGKPLGCITGSLLSVNKLRELNGMQPLEKDITVAFVGYLAVAGGAARDSDLVLLKAMKEMAESKGVGVDWYVAQADSPAGIEPGIHKEIISLRKKAPPSVNEFDFWNHLVRGGRKFEAESSGKPQMESHDIKENILPPLSEMEKKLTRLSKLKTVRKWQEQEKELRSRLEEAQKVLDIHQFRYGLRQVEGLRHVEGIPQENYGEGEIEPPAENSPLNLLIRLANEGTSVSPADLMAVVEALYLYYELRDTKIAGTGTTAWGPYVEHNMKNVRVEDGRVKLQYAPHEDLSRVEKQ